MHDWKFALSAAMHRTMRPSLSVPASTSQAWMIKDEESLIKHTPQQRQVW